MATKTAGVENCSVCGRFVSDMDPDAVRDWYMTQHPGIADPYPYEVYTVTHRKCATASTATNRSAEGTGEAS